MVTAVHLHIFTKTVIGPSHTCTMRVIGPCHTCTMRVIGPSHACTKVVIVPCHTCTKVVIVPCHTCTKRVIDPSQHLHNEGNRSLPRLYKGGSRSPPLWKRGDWGDFPPNSLHYPLRLPQHLQIIKTKHFQPQTCKVLIPGAVFVPVTRIEMLTSIQLDYQFGLWTIKINNIA